MIALRLPPLEDARVRLRAFRDDDLALVRAASSDPERASIGYWVAADFRGSGYATTALGLLTEWALSAGRFERLELAVEPWNEASWRLAELTGFKRERLMRRWQRVGDERKDMFLYARLRSAVGNART